MSEHALAEVSALYIGSGDNHIYRCSFDAKSGAVGEPKAVAETPGPSFIVIHPSGKFLYCTNESAKKISAFAIGSDGSLTLLNQVDSKGGAPTHLVLNRAATSLVVANYMGGVAAFGVDPDGKLRESTSTDAHEGKGPNTGRQERPHPHGLLFSPDERFVYFADLGLDKVFAYRFDAGAATITAAPELNVAMTPGSGPRHLAFSPSGKLVAISGELDNTVTLLSFDAATGKLTPLQTVSTLPPDFKGMNTASEVAFTDSGRELLVSNRLTNNSIVTFPVKDDKLGAPTWIESGGKTPRHFSLAGNRVFIANQDSDTVLVHQIGEGKIVEKPESTTTVKKPQCVVVYPLPTGTK